jgi:hypothetical protein
MSIISTLESEWDRLIAELKKVFEKGVAATPPGATGATGATGPAPAPKA